MREFFKRKLALLSALPLLLLVFNPLLSWNINPVKGIGISTHKVIPASGTVVTSSVTGLEFRGVQWGYGSPYNSPVGRASMQELKTALPHANYIFLNWAISGGDSTPSPSTGRQSDYQYAVELAKQNGLKVHVRIYCMISETPSDIQTWFGHYTDAVVYWAEFAEELGVKSFDVGAENNKVEYDNDELWINLIQEVRAVYSGLIGYNTNNWGANTRELWNKKINNDWFNYLDYIAVSNYWSLSDKPNPSVEDLVYGYHHYRIWGEMQGMDIEEDIRRFSEHFNKPIIFYAGLASAEGAAEYPWRYSSNFPDMTVDLEIQAKWFDAMFQVFQGKPYWKGMLIDGGWFVVSNMDPNNVEFSIQNKPAEQVVADWFERLA